MVTVSEFLIRFPEFAPAETGGLIQAKLDEAVLSLCASSYGDSFDLAHGYLAAHLLAISPFGRTNRMVDDEGNPTSYLLRYREIRAEVVPRSFVTGVC